LGNLGSGFEVVADQISSQAHRSAELTASVAVILTDLTKTMQTATSELRQLADTDREAAAHSRAGAEAALENLQFASSQMQETVAETRRVSETLYTEISNAVVAMQFQDRVSQRIGHVIDSLEAMNQALTSFESAEDISLAERKQQITQSLASSYTMDSERRAHGPEMATVAVAEELAPEDTGDVELF
jgi:methyl-accepting chemotaxis protein